MLRVWLKTGFQIVQGSRLKGFIVLDLHDTKKKKKKKLPPPFSGIKCLLISLFQLLHFITYSELFSLFSRYILLDSVEEKQFFRILFLITNGRVERKIYLYVL